jgi:hypothetical protein
LEIIKLVHQVKDGKADKGGGQNYRYPKQVLLESSSGAVYFAASSESRTQSGSSLLKKDSDYKQN